MSNLLGRILEWQIVILVVLSPSFVRADIISSQYTQFPVALVPEMATSTDARAPNPNSVQAQVSAEAIRGLLASAEHLADLKAVRAADSTYSVVFNLTSQSTDLEPLLLNEVYLSYASFAASNGNVERATTLCNALLRQVVDSSSVSQVTVALANAILGEISARRKDYFGAICLFRRALERWDDVGDTLRVERATMLTNLGLCWQELGILDSAESYLLASQDLRLADSATAELDLAASWNYLGLLYFRRGHSSKSFAMLNRSLTLREAILGVNHRAVAITLGDLVDVYRSIGDPFNARKLQRRICRSDLPQVALHQQSSSLESQLILAQLEVECGDMVAARMQLERLTKAASQLVPRDTDLELRTTNELAKIEIFEGNYGVAERLLRSSIMDPSTTQKALTPALIAIRNNLAVVYAKRRQFHRAEECLLSILGSRPVSPDSITFRVNCYINLANLMTESRDFKTAEQYCRLAVSLLDLMDPEGSDRIDAMNTLAVISKNCGEFDRAHSLYLEVLGHWTSKSHFNDPKRRATLYNLGLLALSSGDYHGADSLLSLARRSGESGAPPPMDEVSLSEVSAKVDLALGRFSPALEKSIKAVELRESSFLGSASYLSQSDAMSLAELLNQSRDLLLSIMLEVKNEKSLRNSNDIDRAMSLLVETSGPVTKFMLERRKLQKRVSVNLREKMDSLEVAKFVQSQTYADIFLGRKTLDADLWSDLARRADSLESEIALEWGLIPSGKIKSGNKSVVAVSRSLPVDARLVIYFRYERTFSGIQDNRYEYAAVVLKRNGIYRLLNLGDASPIDSLMTRYRQHMQRISENEHYPINSDLNEYRLLSERISSLVLLPVMDASDIDSLLILCPDGSLTYLSFAGLPIDSSRYIAETSAILMCSYATIAQAGSMNSLSGSGLLFLGDPDLTASRLQRLTALAKDNCASPNSPPDDSDLSTNNPPLVQQKYPRLPQVRRELEYAWRAWNKLDNGKFCFRLGTGASEEFLKSNSAGFRIIHIATHGFFQSASASLQASYGHDIGNVDISIDPLLRSGLLLAGAQSLDTGCQDSQVCEDGLLSASEVAALDFSGTEAVVLAACESGLGEYVDSEGIWGLRSCFLAGGARFVISAMWKIDDAVSAAFFENLYSQSFLALPFRVAYAQRSQLHLLRTEGLCDHPSVWAGFCITGTW